MKTEFSEIKALISDQIKGEYVDEMFIKVNIFWI